jgi:hypothetical protein
VYLAQLSIEPWNYLKVPNSMKNSMIYAKKSHFPLQIKGYWIPGTSTTPKEALRNKGFFVFISQI